MKRSYRQTRIPPGLLFDEQDRHLIEGRAWHVNRHGYAQWGTTRNGKTVNFWLHSEIMRPPKGMCVDHINGNRLDNRRENLRVVPYAWNSQNQGGAHRDSRTGVRGVSWFPSRNKYIARVRIGGKNHHIGYFTDLEEARVAVIARLKQVAPGFVESRA